MFAAKSVMCLWRSVQSKYRLAGLYVGVEQVLQAYIALGTAIHKLNQVNTTTCQGFSFFLCTSAILHLVSSGSLLRFV